MVPNISAGGAVATQAKANRSGALRALVALDDGHSARQAVEIALAGDADAAYRQTAAIDRHGNVCVFTGHNCLNHRGAIAIRRRLGDIEDATETDEERGGVFTLGRGLGGEGFVVFGNCLNGDAVLQSMYDALIRQPRTMFPPYRLLDALKAGRAAGGDKRVENLFQSAFITTLHTDYSVPLFDLREDIISRDEDPLVALEERAIAHTRHLQIWADESPEVKRILSGYSADSDHPPDSFFRETTLESLQLAGIRVSDLTVARDNRYHAIYRSNESGTWQLWAWDRTTGERWRLTYGPDEANFGAISPDGERVAWFVDGGYRDRPFARPDGAERPSVGSGASLTENLPPAYRPLGVVAGNGITVVTLERQEPDDLAERFAAYALRGGVAAKLCSGPEPIEVASLSADEALVATRHGTPLNCHTRVTRIDTADVVATLRDPHTEVTPGEFAPDARDHRLIVGLSSQGRTIPAIWQPITGDLQLVSLGDVQGELASRGPGRSRLLARWSHNRRSLFFGLDQSGTTSVHKYDIAQGRLTELKLPIAEGRLLGSVEDLNLNPSGGVEITWGHMQHVSLVHFAVGSLTALRLPTFAHCGRIYRPRLAPGGGHTRVMIVAPSPENHYISDEEAALPPPSALKSGYVLVPGLNDTGCADRPLPPECRSELERGNYVVAVDHRGATGHGTPWRAAYSPDAATEDVTDVVADLQRRGILDPRQTRIGGRADGARIALLAAIRNPTAFSEVRVHEPLAGTRPDLERLVAEARERGIPVSLDGETFPNDPPRTGTVVASAIPRRASGAGARLGAAQQDPHRARRSRREGPR